MDKTLADVVSMVIKGLTEGALEGSGREIAQQLRQRHPDEKALAALVEAQGLSEAGLEELETGLIRVGAQDGQLQQLLRDASARSPAGRDVANTTIINRIRSTAIGLLRASSSVTVSGRDSGDLDPKQ